VEGLYTGLCSKRGRAKCGGCPWCETEGIWIHNKVTYPGAVRFLPKNDPLRKQYKKEFKDTPDYQDLHNKTRPPLMTIVKCNRSANNVLQAKRQSEAAHTEELKVNPYVDHDVLSQLFPDVDKLDATNVDPYHEYGNLLNDLRCLIFNIEQTGQHWKKSRRDLEQEFKRFLDLGTKAGWHVKEESVILVQELLRILKVPIGWPDLKGFCVKNKEKKRYMKLAERLAFFSHRGLYILGT